MRPAAILLAIAVLLPHAVLAQTPRYGGRIEVKLIEIDVVVTDGDGNRVYGLTAADFEVFEGRKRQTITNFSEYRASEAAQPDAGATPAAAATAPNAPEPRQVLILIDSLPRIGFVRKAIFDDLQSLQSRLLRPGDRAGVVFWEPGYERPLTIVEPTADREAVRAGLARLAQTYYAGTGPAADVATFFRTAEELEMGVDAEEEIAASERFEADLDLMMFRRKTAKVRALMASIRGGSGRNVLLYVSHSFGMPKNLSEELAAKAYLAELASAANAAGVTFYAVRPHIPDERDTSAANAAPEDAGGLEELMRQTYALRLLTEPTGGLIATGLSAMADLGEQMVADLESYYSIAYHAQSDGRDLERRIEVRPKNRAYRVRARETFVEKSNETAAKEAVVARLFAEQGRSDLTFEIEESTPRRLSGERWHLPIRLRIPAAQLQFADEKQEQVARVKILIVAANGVSEMTKITEDDLRVVSGKHIDPEGFVNYSVKILVDQRGSELSIGVFDERSGLMGVKTIDNRRRFAASASAR